MTVTQGAEVLTELGFTALEAESYVALLQHPPLTGYRLAQLLGKPAANVYKALESLEHKGLVGVDESEPRTYVPVPAAELLRREDRRFARLRARAADAFEGLEPRSADDRVYRLRDLRQISERCRSMIESARFAVLLDGDAGLLEDLGPALETAADRGVHVLVKSYRPLELGRVRVVERTRPEEILENVPLASLVLSVDGLEYLLARIRDDGSVHHALWTRSVVLAYQGYMGLINELTLTELMNRLRGDTTVAELRRAFERDRPLHPVSSRNPVYWNLLRGLGQPGPGPEDEALTPAPPSSEETTE